MFQIYQIFNQKLSYKLPNFKFLLETQLYKEDWIGLKTMDEAGKLHFYDIPGGHLQLSMEWFKTEIIHKFFM